MKLNLGVLDVGYTAGTTPTTTAKVARILEDQYHVMESFYELHKREIHEALNDAVLGAVGDMLADAQPRFNLPLDTIKRQFNDYLDSGEWEQVSGQYIEAAHNRHRVHHRDGSTEMSRRSNRAFVRTGLYEQSFRAWIDP